MSKYNYLKLTIVITLSLFFLLVIASAVLATQQKLTAGQSNHEKPDIYGANIVYQSDQNSNYDIYRYNLTTGQTTQVTSNAANQQNPTIYDNKIVWEDWRNDTGGPIPNTDIYMFNGVSEAAVSTDTATEYSPDIYNDKVVWEKFVGNWNIYLKDLALNQTYQLTSGSDRKINPRIYGNYVVWQNDNDDQIYLYDLSVDSNSNGISNYKESPRPNPDPALIKINQDS